MLRRQKEITPRSSGDRGPLSTETAAAARCTPELQMRRYLLSQPSARPAELRKWVNKSGTSHRTSTASSIETGLAGCICVYICTCTNNKRTTSMLRLKTSLLTELHFCIVYLHDPFRGNLPRGWHRHQTASS